MDKPSLTMTDCGTACLLANVTTANSIDHDVDDGEDLEQATVNSEAAVNTNDASNNDIDAFYKDVQNSLGSQPSPANTSIIDGTDHANRGSVASDSTFLTEDLSRASTVVTKNKSPPDSEPVAEHHSFYDPPSVRRVRALEQIREDEVDLPSWVLGDDDDDDDFFYQQQQPLPSTDRASRKKNKQANRIVFVLGLIGIVFFGLFCGLVIILVTRGRSNDLESRGFTVNTGPQHTGSGGVARVDDDDFGREELPSPTTMPTRSPQQTDPLLSSLLKPSSCQQTHQSPPPLPGKKGIGLMLLNENAESGSWRENLPLVLSVNPYWNYNWGLERIASQPDHIEFVPMVWGGWNAERLRERLDEFLWPQIRNGTARRLLGFNEPDALLQSNMEVQQAIELWPELESVGLPLASPACAYPAKEWMRDFMSIVSEECLRVDWVAVHWYGTPNFVSFRSQMISYYQQYNRPILLTEFAPVNWNATTSAEEFSQEDILDFSKFDSFLFHRVSNHIRKTVKKAIPWLEVQSWIVGYSWFSFKPSDRPGSTAALFETNGTLTDCGRYYASVTTNNPLGDYSIGTLTSLQTRPVESRNCTAYPPAASLPGKKGAALTLRAEGVSGSWVRNLPKLLKLSPYWNYSWGRKRIENQPDNIQFVPQIWGAGGNLAASLEQQVVPHIESGNTRLVLGFQAPGVSNGSNLSVERALAEWPKLESLGVPLVSPSGTSSDPWLSQFMGNVTELCLRVDWVAAHYYGPANVTLFMDTMVALYEQYKRPILITEMAAIDSSASTVDENRFSPLEVLEFMKIVLPWLEEQDWVAGYVWFSFPIANPTGTSSALFDTNDDLTACGEYYASITNENTNGRR